MALFEAMPANSRRSRTASSLPWRSELRAPGVSVGINMPLALEKTLKSVSLGA